MLKSFWSDISELYYGGKYSDLRSMRILFFHELIILIGLFLAFIWQPLTLYYGDSCSNLLIVNALSSYATLDLHEVRHLCGGSAQGQFSLGASGQWYSVHEMMWPVLATPFYVIIGDFGILLFNILGMVLIARFTYLLLLMLYSAEAASLAVSIVILTPPALTGPLSFGSDWPGVVVLMGTLFCLVRGHYLLCGLIGGLILLVRIHGIIAFPAFAVFILLTFRGFRSFRKPLSLVVLGLLPGTIGFVVQNYLLYNDPLIFSYERRLENEFDAMSLIRHSDFISRPTIERVIKLLCDLRYGLFCAQVYFVPVWVFGTIAMIRQGITTLTAILFFTLTSYIAFYSCFPELVEPIRYFNYIIVLSAFPLGALLQLLLRRFDGWRQWRSLNVFNKG